MWLWLEYYVDSFLMLSTVDLPYIWENYRPLTGDQQDTSTCRTPSEHSPFVISPASGVLGAKQMTTFIIRFHPEKVCRALLHG